MQLETKAAFTLDDAGAIAATAWIFADADRVGDVITKGAFSAAAGPIPMLWSHAQDQVIGVWDSVAETAEGLQVRGRLLVDTVEKAAEVYGLLKAGAVNGVSIGFAIKNFARRSAGGRTISAVDLAEISIVSVPAHAGARVTHLKSADHAAHQKELFVEDQIVASDISALETKIVGVADEVKLLSGFAARLDAIEKKAARPAAGVAEKTDDFEMKAFGAYIRRGESGLTDLERKALTVGVDASAGYLAPEVFANEILRKLVEFSPIRAYAQVASIAGPEVKYPKQLTGTNAQWVSEIETRPESSLTYGQVTITPGELATFVEISKQLLEDAAFDMNAEIARALAEDFAIKEGTAFVTGDGVNKPKGLLAAGNGIAEVVSGAAATLGAAPGDTLIGVYSALPTAHAQNGVWLMNRQTLATIRKVKDAQGNYLWQPGLQAGQPSTILGRPVAEIVDLPNIGAGTFPILFGDLSGYRIVDRVGIQTLPDPYSRAKNGITVIHARKRVGGDVTNPDRMVKLKIAAS